MAASNSAEVEKLALGAGMKKGGSAKGELVLAMYELANCFRNGWGIKKDPAAAKQYYETAANLGDTDAMNEVAWCYTEGFGTKKDKVCQLHFVLSVRQLCRHSPLSKLPTSTIPVDVYSSRDSCGMIRERSAWAIAIASIPTITRRVACFKTTNRFLFPQSHSASLFGQQCTRFGCCG
jgi:TPR repeat protein